MDDRQRLNELLERGKPKGCTRRRLKPYIDDCGCAWCEELDRLTMQVLSDRHNQTTDGTYGTCKGGG